MIQGFADKETEHFFRGGKTKAGWQSASKIAARKLDALDAAVKLDDLHSPPGNKLEALRRNRAGQHSIRVNDQWRVCFIWTEAGPKGVEICDYH